MMMPKELENLALTEKPSMMKEVIRSLPGDITLEKRYNEEYR